MSAPIWKKFGKGGKDWIQPSRAKNISMFSIDEFRKFQIFPNLFFAELGDINDLRSKKFGNFVFFAGAAFDLR